MIVKEETRTYLQGFFSSNDVVSALLAQLRPFNKQESHYNPWYNYKTENLSSTVSEHA